MTPARLLHLEMEGFLAALIAIIGYQLLTGAINLKGVLSQSDGRLKSPQLSPGRVQLLLATIAAAATFLSRVFSTTDGRLPEIDHRWLYLTGASSSIYAIEKAFATWRSSNKLNAPN